LTRAKGERGEELLNRGEELLNPKEFLTTRRNNKNERSILILLVFLGSGGRF
jgi:hypothetical protein